MDDDIDQAWRQVDLLYFIIKKSWLAFNWLLPNLPFAKLWLNHSSLGGSRQDVDLDYFCISTFLPDLAIRWFLSNDPLQLLLVSYPFFQPDCYVVRYLSSASTRSDLYNQTFLWPMNTPFDSSPNHSFGFVDLVD